MNDYIAIFVAGVLTGVATMHLVHLAPDVLLSVRHVVARLRDRPRGPA